MKVAHPVRRALLAAHLLLVALVAVACGGQTPAAAPTAAPAAQASAPAGAEGTVTIVHPQGETTLALNPATVVVFDYSALDTLDQLGVAVAGVPQATLPQALAKYKDSTYTNVGTLFEPDYEVVNALKPDLIIVGGRSSAVYPELAKIAPTIDVTVDAANFMESFKAANTNLGIVFGKQNEVSSRLEAIDQAIERVRDAAKGGPTGLILLTTGGKVTAYGPGSRFGLIHDLLGITPTTSADEITAATHGDAISFEFIQEKNPDILFVIDRDAAIGQEGQAASAILDNELVDSTKAATNNNIVYLDGGNWYLAPNGLGTFAAMVGEVAGSLE